MRIVARRHCDLFKKEGPADAHLLERGLLKRETACWIVPGSNPGKLTQRRHCDRREEATLRVPSHRSFRILGRRFPAFPILLDILKGTIVPDPAVMLLGSSRGRMPHRL
jgi:hypothetical protein